MNQVSDRLPAQARRGVAVARDVKDTAQRQQITFLAAAVAYYGFVSLVPLFALVIAVGTTIWGDAVVELMLGWTGDVLTDEGQAILEEALVGGTGRVGATIVGTLVVVWSGLRVFRGVDRAFSQVYDTAGEKSIVGEVRDGLLVILCVAFAFSVMTVVNVVLRLFPLGPLAGLAGNLVVVGTLVVAFLPVYYFFPDKPMSLREALPGAVLAAVGWALLGNFFGVYVGVAGSAGVYGPLGGLLLLITLIYAGSLVMLFGTVVNAVLAGEAGTGSYNRTDEQTSNNGTR